ncbi:MAG: PadR family transcriptional regulator [Candidatus Aenigmatarchaeota archaeon]|nr:MAG: PadR family transcriptional regulator [Candidatus Aenigmarchaeota archaeon]
MQKPSARLARKVEKENLWLFVLSVLSMKSTSGARIKRLVTQRFGFVTGNVTVYKVLYLLQKGGYVRREREGREIVYTTTSKGRSELGKAKIFLKATLRVI